MRHDPKMTRVAASLLVVLAIGAGRLAAQEPGPGGGEEEGPDPTELARQIRRNMVKIEEDLSKAGKHDPARGEQVEQDLQKLLDTMKRRQDQVIKDIDDIVKQFKVCGGGGGSGSRDSNENQGKSRPRDRNKSQSGKPRDPNAGQQPKDGKQPQNQKGGGPEDNRPKPLDEGDNTTGARRGEPSPEKVPHVDLNEIWGNLPPEIRQRLVDRNYDEFTPEYEAQIREYFKRMSTPEKK